MSSTAHFSGALRRNRHIVALLAIVALAALLRLYRLETLPLGMWHDEAYNALDALSLIEGAPRPLFHEVWEYVAHADRMENLLHWRWPIFFYGTYGREPLFCYLLSLSLALFGVRVLAVRLVPALFGIGTIPAVYWLALELFSEDTRRARRIGLLAAASVAIWYWMVHFSRFGIRGMMLPFLSSLTIATMLRGLRTGRKRAWIASGFWLGVSLYTFSAARMLPLVIVAGWLAIERCSPGFLLRRWREWVWVILISALVFAPLGIFYLRYPDWFWMRTQYIVQDNLDVETVGERYINNIGRVLGALFIRGEDFLRHNLPRRPMLDPAQAAWFLAGLGMAVWRGGRGLVRRSRQGISYVLLLIWIPVMLLPTYLTSDAPHFGRAIGITPALAVLMGLGMDVLWSWARRRKQWIWAAGIGIALALTYTGYRTTVDYFVRWANHPDMDADFQVDLVSLARYARTLSPDEMVYMTPPTTRYAAILFTLGGHQENRIKSYTGSMGAVPAGREDRAATYLVRAGDEASLDVLRRRLPQGEVVAQEAYFTAYRVPIGSDRVQPARVLPVDWMGQIALLGYDMPEENPTSTDSVPVTLYWRALSPVDRDYTFFVHLVGEVNPATGSPVWAQHDARPGNGTYGTLAWVEGEIVVDEYTVPIPADLPPGEYELWAGFYYLPTLERLPVLSEDGQVIGDHVILERIHVE